MRPEINTFAMRQGLMLGCLFAGSFIVSTVLSMALISWLIQGVILWYVYRSGVKCREEILGGEMSYGMGLWYITQLFLYSSMLAGVFKYVYLKWINTGYLIELDATMEDVIKAAKMTITSEEAEMMQKMLTPENMAIYPIAFDVMIGFVIGLVLAMVLKRTNN